MWIIVVHHYSKGGARANSKDGYSLSGNTKIVNDAHRIVLLERKKFDEDDSPTEEDKACMTVILDKGRGYDSGIRRHIYFIGGIFDDKFLDINMLILRGKNFWHENEDTLGDIVELFVEDKFRDNQTKLWYWFYKNEYEDLSIDYDVLLVWWEEELD